MQGLPWGALTEFMGFQDVLTLRLVCREWNQSLQEEVSVEWCRSNLSTILKAQNCYAFQSSNGTLETSWDIGATQDRLNDLLLYKNPPPTPQITGTTKCNDTSRRRRRRTCFEQLLMIVRIVHSLPKSILVAFSTEFGRHCRPIHYNNRSNTSQIKQWERCKRHNCPTCKLTPARLPNESWTGHGELADVQERHGPINMVDYIPICVPNIPPDLTCPKCHIQDHRTLVLSEFSYRATRYSPSHRPAHANLVWSPDVQNTIAQSNDRQDETTRPTKRSRMEHFRQGLDTKFPPRYAEMASPTRSEPISLPMDAKFCISIHCTTCREFAVWAPASVCRHSDFVCHERGRQIPKDKLTVGGALVRTQCSLPDCNQAIACPHCAHQVWHDPYSAFGGDRQVRRVSHCDVCRETYCSDHAWVSTVCHHW